MAERRPVILVEGDSDVAAVGAVARRRGLDLDGAGIDVVAVGGFGGFAAAQRAGREANGVSVLCDANEARWVTATVPTASVHVCHADLEDELIRAVGIDAVEAIVEAAGEMTMLAAFRRQPAQQGRPPDAQLRRFLGTKSGRKIRYGRLLGEAVEPDRVPAPIAGVLDAAFADLERPRPMRAGKLSP